MNALLQDVRYAFRGLLQNRGFTLVAVLTIGIGIGANTTVFSWLNALLLDPVPGAAAAQRIVGVENVAANGAPLTTSYRDYTDFRTHLRSFDRISLTTPLALAVGDDDHSQRTWGEMVSGNYFDMMRLQPAAGRFFAGPELDDTQNVHQVAVIGYSYWKNQYGLNRSAIGSTIRINRTPFTIIGVAPERFHGSQAGLSFDLWLPVTMYGQVTHTGTWMLRDRQTRNFLCFGRLRDGVTIEQARSEVRTLAHRMSILDADTNAGVDATVLPLWQGHFTAQSVILAPVAILMGASAVLLLIVCANLANLLLARATGRRREFGVRLSLGAAPSRLSRLLLTETLLLALAGAAAGLLIASWLGGTLGWLMPKAAFPSVLQPSLDVGVLLFTTALAAAVTVLAGVAPAINAARADVNEILKESGRGSASGRRASRLRAPLVVCEVALSVVALVGAGLFLKSFAQSSAIRPGFEPAGVALARFDFSSAGYTAAQTDSFCRRLREALERHPGITMASYDDSPPLGLTGPNWEPLQVEGYTPGRNESMKINRDMVSPGFFAAMKIPLLEGRDFDLRDAAPTPTEPRQRVMIVNREFARRFFPGQDPIGHKVQGWGAWFTVVGVVENSKYHTLTEAQQPFFYIPIRQIYRPEYGTTFEVRTAGPVSQAVAAIRSEAAALDPALMLFDNMSLEEYIAGSLYGQKVGAVLLNVLGAVALLLAAFGLYSVMAYSVAQRTGEIGIRMTLGAQPLHLMAMVLRQGLTLALIGLALGVFAAAALAHLAAAALFSVSTVDPAVYAGAAAFTVAIALLAAGVPAWRALRVDPMTALRSE